MRNEEVVMRTTARNPADGIKQASTSCVIPCTAGDKVYVWADNTDQGYIAVWGENLSSFSGFIIHNEQVQCDS